MEQKVGKKQQAESLLSETMDNLGRRRTSGSSNMLQDLQQTGYIIQCSADRLQCDRAQCTVISDDRHHLLMEQESSLVKHFARIVVLQHDRKQEGEVSADGCNDRLLSDKGEVFGSLQSWLRVVNIETAAIIAIGKAVKSLFDLLHKDQDSLKTLCDSCQVQGENARRLLVATSNLKKYTNRWIDLGHEPVAEYRDIDLCWYSFDQQSINSASVDTNANLSPRHAFLTHQPGGNGRPASESADSGVASNVSQTSLPTTTPPPSPGLLLAPPSISVGGGHHCLPTASSHRLRPSNVQTTARVVARGSKATTSSTLPALTLRWKSSLDRPISGEPTDAEEIPVFSPSISRSRSHETNLPHRIIKAEGVVGAKPVTTLSMAMSRSATEGGGGAFRRHASTIATAEGAATHSRSHLASPAARSRFHSSQLLSPTSPMPPGSASFFSNQSSTHSPSPSPSSGAVPKSPVAGRLMHNIPHKWSKRHNIRHLTDPCQVCRRPLGFVSEKCRTCKIKVHSDCKVKLGVGTCGLSPDLVRELLKSLVTSGTNAWQGDGQNPLERSPNTTNKVLLDGRKIPSSRSDNSMMQTTLTPGPSDSFESSSSTNSSAPSTPALLPCGQIPDRSPYTKSTSKFLFPDVPEVPDIVLQETIEGKRDILGQLQDSNSSTIRVNSVSSGITQEVGQPPDATQETEPATDSEEAAGASGTADAPPTAGLGHSWSRTNWNMTTIRGVSSSVSAWRDVTIAFDKIQFAADSLIGRGAFGDVHKGYWYQPVAVKLLNMDHVNDQQQLEAFKQEAASFKNTRHENIVLFVGYCLDPSKLGIVMNYCRGKTLHNVVHNSRSPIDVNRAVHISTQICQGMSYLHTKGILHKDLRTKNIFLEGTEKGSGPVSDKRRLEKVVITDFGLFSMSRLCKLRKNQTECKVLRVPENWLRYLAPEMMRHLTADKRGEELPFSNASDVYSFGTIWYELLTGEFPFKKYPAEVIVWQVGRGLKPPLSHIHNGKELKEILMQCYAYEADKRPDFNSVLKTLERLPKKRFTRSPSFPARTARSAEAIF